MDRKKLLVVATAPVEAGPLRDAVREHAGDEAEIRVVAPASDVSPLQWLASDEDEAREKAAGVASEAAESVEPEAARTEAEVGDMDPVQAIEDALRTFDADEVLVVTRPEDDATWLEQDSAQEARERFGVPVTRLTV
jgi:GABA permease